MRFSTMIALIIISVAVLCLGVCQEEQKQAVPTNPPEAMPSNYHLSALVDSLSSDTYYSLLDSLQNGISVDLLKLRMALTKTKEFSPYDTDLGEKHRRIRSALDNSQYRKALAIADSILSYNYVDIDVHLYCGYAYKQLGDSLKSDFHYSLYDGLLNSVVASGDGKTAKTALWVISTTEEYAFIRAYNLSLEEQSLYHEDSHSFDLMEVTDRESQEKHKIYFNIDIPIGYMGALFNK